MAFQKEQIFVKKNIPNALTILRIIFMVIVIVCILVRFGHIVYALPLDSNFSSQAVGFYSNDIIAASFFVLASITDFLDGYLARKFHWVSDFGKLWDPLADKLLVDGVLICFAYLSLIPIWIVVILILRDLIVDAFRMSALNHQIVVAADWSGKMKTFFEMVGLIFIFFFFHFTKLQAITTNELTQWYLIQNLFILIALFFSLYSMVSYIKNITKVTGLKNKAVVDNKLPVTDGTRGSK